MWRRFRLRGSIPYPLAEVVGHHGRSGDSSSISFSIQDLDQFFRQVDRNPPAGGVLFLEASNAEAAGGTTQVVLQWSFRRPGPPPFDKPEIVVSGELPLVLRQVGEEWKVSHIEQLIAAISEEVVLK